MRWARSRSHGGSLVSLFNSNANKRDGVWDTATHRGCLHAASESGTASLDSCHTGYLRMDVGPG